MIIRTTTITDGTKIMAKVWVDDQIKEWQVMVKKAPSAAKTCSGHGET